MKTEYRPVVFGLLLGLIFWFVDAAIDSVFFDGVSFWDSVIFNVPGHEVYVRSVSLALFASLGLLTFFWSRRWRRLAAAAAEQRDRLSQVLDVANVMIVAVDENEAVSMVNPKACEVLKGSEADIVGRNWFETFLPEDQKEEVRKVYGLLMLGRTDLVEHFENPVLDLEGRQHTVAWHNSYVRDRNGRINGILSSGQDVTKERKLLLRLKESEERLRFAMEASGFGYWDWRPQTDEVYYSSGWTGMLGYTQEEVPPTFRGFADLLHPDDLPSVQEQLEACFSGVSKAFTTQFRMRCKDGSYKHVQACGKVVERDEDGSPRRMLGTHVDITAQKDAERGLQRQIQEQRAMEWVSQAVQNLRKPDGLRTVVQVVRDAMDSIGLDFQLLSIHRCLDEATARFATYLVSPEGRLEELVGERQNVLRLWKTGRPVYRSDLDRDAGGITEESRAELARLAGAPIRCILDVPHASGTLALASATANAFTDDEIAFVERVAGVLSVGIGRADDLERLASANQELRESEERIRSVLETVRAGVVLVDAATHRIVDANPAACEMIQVDRDEILGKACHGYICTAEPGKRPVTDLDADADNAERVLMRADGSVVPILKTVRKVNLAGRPHLVESFLDITQLKQAQADLEKRVKELNCLYGVSRLMEQQTQSMHAILQGVADLMSQAFRHPAATSVRITFGDSEYRSGVGSGAVDNQVTDILVAGSKEGEIQVATSVEGAGDHDAFLDEERELVSAIAERIGRIVERRRAAAALRDSEERFRAITSSAQDAIVMIDNGGLVTYWNESAERTFGYSRNEMLGRNLHELLTPERFREAHGAAFPKFQKTGEGAAVGKTLELAAIRKDGKEIPVELSLAAAKMQGTWYAVGILRDITDRKRIQKEMVAAREAAEEASRAKSEFLANMSHEIRTPMNGIIGMTELALDTALTDEQREFIRAVQSSADSLMGIINDILDFSKIEAGRLSLDPAPFGLRDMLGQTLKALGFRAGQKGLELTCDTAEDVPDALVGDEGRLKQVVVNLTGNAIKFTEQGEVGVHVSCDGPGPNGGIQLRFSVSDTGIGIPREKQDAIFEAFTQADGSTTRRFGGTGLGLTISSQLVQMMGGRIWVESPLSNAEGGRRKAEGEALSKAECGMRNAEGGPGSVFHFTVVMGVQDDAETARDHGAPVAGRLPQAGPGRRGLRVLLAEDNPINQKVTVRTLERAGHEVVVAADGLEALERLDGGSFDVVLMDVQMPRMDGLATTAEIRKREASTGEHVPILAMTAYAMEGDRERCVEAGMDGYVSKPVKPDELVAAVMGLFVEDAVQADGGAPGESEEDGDRGPAFSHEGALENAGDDREFLCELIEMFPEQADGAIAQLRQALSDGDAETVMRTGHTIKGTVGNFCAKAAAEAAYRVEMIGREGRMDEAKKAIDALEKELARLGEELKAYAEA